MAAFAVSLYLCGTLEDSFLGTMTLYKGNFISAILDRPIGGVVFLIAVGALAYSAIKNIRAFLIKHKSKQK